MFRLLIPLLILAAIAPVRSANPLLRIGAPLTSGAFARFGEDFQTAWMLWAEYVKASGGIVVKGVAHDVELIFVDVGSDATPNRTNATFADFALAVKYGNIDFSFAPYSSGLTPVAAMIAHRLKPRMVIMSTGAASDEVFTCDTTLAFPCTAAYRRRFPRLWGLLPSSRVYFSTLAVLSRLKSAKSLAVFYENTSLARSACLSVVDQVRNLDVKVVAKELITNLTTPTAERILNTIKALQVDLTLICAYDAFCAVFNKASKDMGFVPPGIGQTPCVVNEPYIVTPSTWEPIVTGSDFTPSAASIVRAFLQPPGSNMTAAMLFNQSFFNRTNRTATYQAAMAFAGAVAFQSAIFMADSLDPDAVNAAMAAVSETSVSGKISFDTHGRTQADMLSVQVDKNRNRQIIAPLVAASMEFVFPAPTFPKRACVDGNKCGHGVCQDDGGCLCEAGWAAPTCVQPVPAPESPAGIIVAVVIPVLFLIAIALAVPHVLKYLERVKAPRGDVATILFTDIEGSSDLWSVASDDMGDVIDTHHEIIRKCIRRHGGYEVKTIGDAFMIACKTPSIGHKIALDIQSLLYEQSWPAFVRAFYKARHPADTDLGLRVRVGLHTGEAKSVQDEVTHRIDYYGPAVNLCARVESAAAGAQVLCTQPHLDALASPCHHGSVETVLGMHCFKGCKPTAVVQISLSRFEGRGFPPLAVPRYVANPDEVQDLTIVLRTNESFASRTSSRGSADGSTIPPLLEALLPFHPLVQDGHMSEEAAGAHILEGVAWFNEALRPLDKKARSRIGEEIARAWKVSTHDTTMNTFAVMSRAATKVHKSRTALNNSQMIRSGSGSDSTNFDLSNKRDALEMVPVGPQEHPCIPSMVVPEDAVSTDL